MNSRSLQKLRDAACAGARTPRDVHRIGLVFYAEQFRKGTLPDRIGLTLSEIQGVRHILHPTHPSEHGIDDIARGVHSRTGSLTPFDGEF